MKNEKETILKALNLIKEVCSKQIDTYNACTNCPFYTEHNNCNILNHPPNRWEIQGETDKWRAFYG